MVQSLDNGLHTGLVESLSKYSPTMPAPSRLALIRQLNQLVRELAEPVDLMAIHREQMLELAAIRSLLSMGVFRAIPEQGSISAVELGAKVNAEEGLLLRLMKMAVASQILIQHQDESFAHTKYSRSFAAELGTWLDFKVVYDECFMPLSRLHLWMKEKGRIEPDCQETSPSLWMDGNEGKTFWEVLKADKERSDDFNLCMKVKGENSPKGAYYDFDGLVDARNPERTVLVDVGGGLGQTLLEVIKQCPNIAPSKLVLQDQPQVIAAAEASGLLPAEMKVMPYDYNNPQPIYGARGYMMRRVLHSYSDKKCIEVLKTLTPAMAPDSKLLISDFIVPEVASPDEIGSISAALAMMGQGGKERTITDFKRVLDGAGLELTGVFKPKKGPFGMIEASLKPVGCAHCGK